MPLNPFLGGVRADRPWRGLCPTEDPPRRFATAVVSRHPSQEGISLGSHG